MGDDRALMIGVGRFASGLAGDEEPAVGAVAWHPLEFVYEVLPRVERSLRGLGYETTAVVDPEVAAVREAGARITDDGFRIVHVVSHGAVSGHGDPGRVDVVPSCTRVGAGTNVSEWISTAQTLRRPTLFLVDLCGSGRAARLPFLTQVPDRDTYAWVIAASGADEEAYDGRFSSTVAEVFDELSRTGLGTDTSRSHVSFSVVARRIRERAEALPGLPQTVHATAMDLALHEPELPFFPNPRYREDPARRARQQVESPVRAFLEGVEEPDALDAEHFAGRAGKHYVGRASQLRTLAPWLGDRTAGGLRVVTGSPGAGKSALLGALVCAAHPELAAVAPHIRARLRDEDPACCPAEQRDLAALHARQRSLGDLLRSLARQLGLEAPAAGWSAPALVRAVAGFPAPPAIVLDALDEATAPQVLAADLLLPLARTRRADGLPACRLLVGMRPWEEFAELSDLAAAGDGLVDLNAVDAAEVRHDLERYLLSRLADLDGYRGGEGRAVRERLAATVAGRLTDPGARGREWGAFLVASVFVRYADAAPPVAAEGEAERFGATVPTTLPDVLELDLLARADHAAVRTVLRAAAHAKGEGMPAELLTRVAQALDPEPELDDERVQELLDASRFYLRTAVERDGTTLYRIFHQGLADHLVRPGTRSRWRRRKELGPEAAIFEALCPSRWESAPAYLLRHSIAHARDAGRADELLEDGGFLVHADPETVLPSLDNAESGPARSAAAVYRTSVGIHRSAGHQARRQLLAVDAARHGARGLQKDLTGQLPPGTWRPLWATGSQLTRALRHTITLSSGVAMAACTTLGDRPVVVTGNLDGQVQVWDLATGQLRQEMPNGHSDWIAAGACATVDGRPLAVTASRDGELLIWDLAAEQLRFELPAVDGGWVTALVCTEAEGRPLAMSMSHGGALRAWDLGTGEMRYQVTTGHAGNVEAMAMSRTKGRPVVVTADETGYVRGWDAATGRLVHEVGAGAGGRVWSIACTTWMRRGVVGVASDDGNVRFWDLVTGRELAPLAIDAARYAVRKVACTSRGGRPTVLTCLSDSDLLAWNLATGERHDEPLTGHNSEVKAVDFTEVNGRPTAVTGSLDSTVRVWDLPSKRPSLKAAPRVGAVRGVDCATVDGRSVVVTGHVDRTLRTWDMDSGRLRGELLASHTGAAGPVACTTVGGRPVAVTCGYLDDEPVVRVWDLLSGQPHGGPLAGHTSTVGALACTTVGGRPVAVSGCLGGKVIVWDLADGRMLHELLGGNPSGAHTVACAQVEGVPVAVVGFGNKVVRLWNLETGRPYSPPLKKHEGMVVAAACTTVDGRPVAVTGSSDGAYSGSVDAKAHVWDIATQRPYGEPLSGHTGWVVAAACTKVDGRSVAFTGGQDGTLRMWDMERGECLQTLTLPGVVNHIAVAGDGRLAIGSEGELIVMERPEEAR
ncbi:hypothetical protein [Streptomyces sp. NPDC017988]|uniref:beta-propeller domain-containing protein n=1 Tax=Streptomyces sp. NPDC017988 TaxID=3365025 RepID=UPI00378FFB26